MPELRLDSIPDDKEGILVVVVVLLKVPISDIEIPEFSVHKDPNQNTPSNECFLTELSVLTELCLDQRFAFGKMGFKNCKLV